MVEANQTEEKQLSNSEIAHEAEYQASLLENTTAAVSPDVTKIQVLKKDLSKDEEEMKQLELKKKQDDEHVLKLTQDLKQQGEEVKKLESQENEAIKQQEVAKIDKFVKQDDITIHDMLLK